MGEWINFREGEWLNFRDPVTEVLYRIGGDVISPLVEVWRHPHEDQAARVPGEWLPAFEVLDPSDVEEMLARALIIEGGPE